MNSNKKPVILLVNDDGFGARGVEILREVMASIAIVNVVVPDRDRSGAGQSLTLHRPIKVKWHADDYAVIEGTPADCVHLGITGLYEIRPDFVVSGINHGANLGNDILYSGTVAGAMEGCCNGVPSIAFSLVGRRNFDTAAQICESILQVFFASKMPDNIMLNVNLPDVEVGLVAGVELANLGRRMPSGRVTKSSDPRGHERYWIGLPGKPDQVVAGSDFYAIEHNFVSVTPLSISRNVVKCGKELDSFIAHCNQLVGHTDE